MKPLVIAIDFDGTIVKNRWPENGKLRWLAEPVLNWLKHRGHVLILNTCREGKMLYRAENFLMRNCIFFDYCNENAKHLIEKYGDCRKIGADLYLDDKAFFPGWLITWLVVLWMERRKQ